jgi:succinyl-CoA synthetase alpha subunit
MGHAGAIVRGSQGTFASKQQALRDANVTILETPIDVIEWAQGIC